MKSLTQKGQNIPLKGVTQILTLLTDLYNKDTFLSTLKQSKRISKLLTYYLKYQRFIKQGKDAITNNIYKCINLLKWFIDSSQYRKFGHCYQLYFYIIKSFNDFNLNESKVGSEGYQENILSRMQKNQKQMFYNSTLRREILSEEIKFLSNQRFNYFIQSLQNQKIVIPNPECICCCPVFLKNFTISNSNPIFSQILTIPSIDNSNLQKYLTSIANQNGGIILIGANKTKNNLKVQGLPLNNILQKKQVIQSIQQSILKIKPLCKYLIQEVPVFNSLFQSEDIFKDQHIALCLRIMIFPCFPDILSYLKFITSKNKLEYYESYQLDLEGNLSQIKFLGDFQSNMYSIIHKKYKNRGKCNKQQTNSHEGIICYRPIPYNPIILLNNQGEHLKSLQKFQEYFTDQLRFKYSRATLLIVSSSDQDRQIQLFGSYLFHKKHLYQLEKAYPDSFKCNYGDRSVWILTHKLSFINIQGLLQKAEEDKAILKSVIRAMPVQKVLQIQESKFSAYNEKNFDKKFKHRYPEGYHKECQQFIDKKNNCKKLLFLTFSGLQQAVYAFMTMQELNLKPFFTKPGQVYQKKS